VKPTCASRTQPSAASAQRPTVSTSKRAATSSKTSCASTPREASAGSSSSKARSLRAASTPCSNRSGVGSSRPSAKASDGRRSRRRRPGHRTLRHCLACRTPGHDGRPAAPGTQRRWPAPGHRRLPRSRARERLRPRGRRGERACRKPLRHVQVHDDDIREHVVDASMNDDLPVGLEYRELVSQRGVVRDHHDPGSLRRHPRACRRGRGRGANLVVEQRANRRRIDWGPSRSGRCGCFSTDGSDSNTSSRGWRTGGLSSNSSSSLEASSSRTKTRRSASSRPARWTLRVTPAP
jgi:hypothetical protein